MSGSKRKYRAERKYWRDAWVVGVVVYISYNIFSIKLFHLYIYFFAISIVALFSGWMGWSQISEKGVLLRFGVFRYLKLFISWKEIEEIDQVFLKKRLFVRGFFGAIRTDEFYDILCISIKLKNELTSDRKHSISKIMRRIMVDPAIDCGDNETILILRPPGDVNRFISDVEASLSMLSNSKMVEVNKIANPKPVSYCTPADYFLILFPIFIFIIFQ